MEGKLVIMKIKAEETVLRGGEDEFNLFELRSF